MHALADISTRHVDRDQGLTCKWRSAIAIWTRHSIAIRIPIAWCRAIRNSDATHYALTFHCKSKPQRKVSLNNAVISPMSCRHFCMVCCPAHKARCIWLNMH